MLTTEAFNALLKTLEEPPAFVKFIFATTQPNKVLPTILSRCQRFDFRRIPTIEIIAQLEKISAEEKIKIDKEVLFAIAKASDGALRDAESLLDQLASFSQGTISLNDINSILGIVQQDALFEITEKIAQKDAKSALAVFNKIIDEGKDVNLFLTNLIEHFRNLMVAKIVKADPKLIDLPQEICERLLQQSQAFTLEEIFGAFNTLINTQEMAKRLDSLRIPLEVSLIKLAHDKRNPTSNPAPAKELKKPGEAKENNNPTADDDPPAHKEDPAGSISLDNFKQSWQNIIDGLSRVKMYVATYMSEGSPINLEHNVLTVSFPKNYSLHKESLEKKENKALIEKIISELLHANLRVNFILSKESLHKDENENNPMLKSALDAFGARVIRQE
jgi:DNA polymerase-3 subunit gamma/tau